MDKLCELSLFDFNGDKVRVTTIDGEPWFVAADFCRALGLQNIPQATKSLRPDQHQHLFRSNITTADVGFPNRGAKCVSEGGLYDLLFNSRKPAAKAFMLWVTHTVLPTIRKDGAYIKGEEKLASGEMDEDEFVLKAMTILRNKVERVTAERDTARTIVDD